jgi:mono/diheme cytochrome c family protein
MFLPSRMPAATATFARWTPILAGCILSAAPVRGAAQGDTTKVALTTRSGVFTAEQATEGRRTYRGTCESCHETAEFSTRKFWDSWAGRTLAELFRYLRTEMPKDNPYSIADDEYAAVTAYILQLGGASAGTQPLSSDSVSLAKILIVHTDTTKPGTRK